MKIVVTHPDPDQALQWAKALGTALHGSPAEVIIDSPELPRPADQRGAADALDSPDTADASEVICAVGWKPPADFFRRHRTLQAFFCAGAGVDHLLQHPELPEGLPLVRLEDAGMGSLMADYCLHALLHIAGGHTRFIRQQRRADWVAHEPLPRTALPVGIVGMGVLGRQVAQRLQQAGFTVRGFTRTEQRIEQRTEGIEVMHGEAGWARFLACTRVLILLAPRTPQTENLIDAQALQQMPAGGWLINVARGALVVDADLLAALDQGHLEGAILDVFREEPLPAQHPFWHHPGVLVTPHVSAPTQVEPSARQVADNLRRLARGEPLRGAVDRSRGY